MSILLLTITFIQIFFFRLYWVSINYRRILLRHNLSRKCRKIVKFVSITHSERTFGMVLQSLLPSRGKSVNQCWREMVASPSSVVGVSQNLRDVTVLWRFDARSDGNFNVLVLLRRRSEDGMNNFITEDASVIKERVARGGQVVVQQPQTTPSAPGHPGYQT